jgi:Predicted P-loop ATPase and inactivated derivatives
MDDIKVDNAEQVERVLGRMWLVCIDEYNAKTDREQAKIKRLLTEKDVQVRRMRSDQYLLTQRMASFIATTNERQPLTDPTGSRRYLCVEVDGMIDTDSPIDYPQLYAQALHELAAGERYWLTKDEEQALEEHNRPYQATTAADQLLADHFEPAEVSRQTLTTATELLNDLREQVRAADMPTMRQLTTWLKNHGFRYGAQQGRHGWYVRKKETATTASQGT